MKVGENVCIEKRKKWWHNAFLKKKAQKEKKKLWIKRKRKCRIENKRRWYIEGKEWKDGTSVKVVIVEMLFIVFTLFVSMAFYIYPFLVNPSQVTTEKTL